MATRQSHLIHDGASVQDVITLLTQFDPKQRLLIQAILPDGTAWNAPASIGVIPQSNCGDGLAYLYLQIRCEGGKHGSN